VFTKTIFLLAGGKSLLFLFGGGKNQRSLERDGIEGETPVWFFSLRGKRFFWSTTQNIMGRVCRVGLLDSAALNGW